jgi:hypothetical protein
VFIRKTIVDHTSFQSKPKLKAAEDFPRQPDDLHSLVSQTFYFVHPPRRGLLFQLDWGVYSISHQNLALEQVFEIRNELENFTSRILNSKVILWSGPAKFVLVGQ